MEVTKKMTSSTDIILKSWLRTLRYSIEYYEDTFDSKNNRRRENNRRAKNMVIGGDSSDDSDDGRYVNIWECSVSENSASKLKNSLESVGNVSEVSNFENEYTSVNTVSGSDFSTGSYSVEEADSACGSFGEKVKITDLDNEDVVADVKRIKKKPVATPRLSKSSQSSQAIYVNLPLITQNSFEDSTKDTNHHSVVSSRTQERLSTYSTSESSPIYENLPLPSKVSKESPWTSTDSVKFEAEVFSTIQFLEDVIESVDTYSDQSESDEVESILSEKGDSVNLESDYSTLDSKFKEEVSRASRVINDKKFTDSSSSFEEYLNKDQLWESEFEVEAQSLDQRFTNDNRVSAFFEESEPVLPQEIKSIPVPKSENAAIDLRNRFSVPLRFTEGQVEVRRPLSLDVRVVSQSTFAVFSEILPPEAVCPTFKEKRLLDEEFISTKSEGSLGSSDTFKVSLREKDKLMNSDQNLKLSFAKESRISSVFQEGEVEELHVCDPLSESLVVDEQEFIDNLREDVVSWMASLMDEYCGELENIMEDKELLKSINQVPKDRPERPTESRFPLDDVEVRGKPQIRTHRMSKTTDFDAGRRRQTSPINPKNFEIRGIVKIGLLPKPILTRWKEEYIAYENENFYRINEKTKNKELLASNVIIKSVRYPKSKESKEVELKDSRNVTYMLHFQELKYAKQFMENEKIQVYITDNKVTIKKTLLRFLGKRSSREILEKKGIYKNETIFGNTLRDIYFKSGTNSLVPIFIYEVIRLLEKPENIKSLGVYRTSGNLATIQKIRFEVDNGRLGILEQYAKDPDVLTGSLKLFFRELKEPLIPREVCDKLLDFAKLDLKQISSKDHQKIRSILIKHLHESNLETFVVLMRHLVEVVKYKEHNKMDAFNLAVCWGPSIIFAAHGDDINTTIELSKDIVTQSQDATRLVDFFLVYYELYPAELGTLGKRQRPESISEKIQSLRRQESKDSVGSLDSSKSNKKSISSQSLSVDEVTKKLVEVIEPHVSSEGLYRKSGSTDKTSKIMKKLNKKKINELDKYKNDVHDLTDALKRYLKEQDSLVSEETVETVLKTSPDCSQSCLEPSTRRKVISLIEDNPKKDTFIFLLRHLAKVLDYQERTYGVPKNDLIYVWTSMLHNQKKTKLSNEEFAKFLAVSVTVFNDNLPDVVRSSLNNNGNSPNRNDSMDELMKEMKEKNRDEKDRNSRYDNVDSDVGEAPENKTEQTKL